MSRVIGSTTRPFDKQPAQPYWIIGDVNMLPSSAEIKLAETEQAIKRGIGELIAHGENITSKNIVSFLKSSRGLALAFWAMNGSRDDGLNFYVAEREWRNPGVAPPVGGDFKLIIDCHTHYIQTKFADEEVEEMAQLGLAPGERTGNHTDSQYRQGALRNWWFFPEAYDFTNLGKSDDWPSCHIGAPSRTTQHARNQPLHGVKMYRDHMEGFYQTIAGHGREFRFFITPAPYSSAPTLTGRTDTASYFDMRNTCNAINKKVGKVICHPVGTICNPNPETTETWLVPDNVADYESRLWKIYPRGQWSESERSWLRNELPMVLREFPGEHYLKRNWHTVMLHWWDGTAPGNDSIGAVADENAHVCFVLYHACHRQEPALWPLLNRQNIFAEIGGTFAYQILGLDGGDRGHLYPPCSLNHGGFGNDNDNFGPNAARRTIRILRGDERGSGQSSGRPHQNDAKILWGTDAIWHGSPAWQIEAFRRLKLTAHDGIDEPPEDKSFKRKVLGENASHAFSIL